MLVKRIAGATRDLGAPTDWNHAENGKCIGLPVLDVVDEGVKYMVSAWEPTPDELAKLNNGGSVYLWVSGEIHPVVAISVEKAVDNEI